VKAGASQNSGADLRAAVILAAALVLLFALRLVRIPVSPAVAALSLIVFMILVSLYVLSGVPGLRRRLRGLLREQPRRLWLLPAGLWTLSLIYGGLTGQFDLYLVAGGLIYCAVPCLLIERLRSAEPQLGILDLVVIIYLWFPVEFGWVPDLSVPPLGGMINYYHIAALILLITLYLVVRNLPDVGFTYRLRGPDIRTAIHSTLLFLPLALILGFPTGFIALNPRPPGLAEMAAALLAVYFFTGLPEELLFRGVIHNLIERRLLRAGRSRTTALIVSSIVFGLSHGNNNDAPFLEIPLGPLGVWRAPWVYMILATLAGFFYGWTYIKTRRVTAAALVHALVDWLWGMFFHA